MKIDEVFFSEPKALNGGSLRYPLGVGFNSDYPKKNENLVETLALVFATKPLAMKEHKS
jgi:hypothetical protein